jgi:hypothetical protein
MGSIASGEATSKDGNNGLPISPFNGTSKIFVWFGEFPQKSALANDTKVTVLAPKEGVPNPDYSIPGDRADRSHHGRFVRRAGRFEVCFLPKGSVTPPFASLFLKNAGTFPCGRDPGQFFRQIGQIPGHAVLYPSFCKGRQPAAIETDFKGDFIGMFGCERAGDPIL